MTNKLYKILTVILTLILTSKSAFCYTLSNAELLNVINSKLQIETKEQLKKYSFINQNDFKITVSGIPYNSIETNEGIMPKIEIQSQNRNFQKNSPRRILIKDSKGTIIKAFSINVQTLVYADVLTAAKTINFNEEINSNNTIIERKEISNILEKVILKVDNNIVSKRNYQKGNVILSDSIKEKSAVLKDSLIDIIFLSDSGLMIKLQGKALKEGSVGDMILVRSNKYNKVYNAKINSSNEVTVKI